MSTHVTCGHCDGNGVCYRGDDSEGRNSCDSCRDAERNKSFSQYSHGIVVKCSICNGTGWVKVSR
jgi:hypothetical protein